MENLIILAVLALIIGSAARYVWKAKKRGVTVTAYLTAVLILSCVRVQESLVRNPKRLKPIKILIPVNLRSLFPSKTLRNFVLYTTPEILPALGSYSMEEICLRGNIPQF